MDLVWSVSESSDSKELIKRSWYPEISSTIADKRIRNKKTPSINLKSMTRKQAMEDVRLLTRWFIPTYGNINLLLDRERVKKMRMKLLDHPLPKHITLTDYHTPLTNDPERDLGDGGEKSTYYDMIQQIGFCWYARGHYGNRLTLMEWREARYNERDVSESGSESANDKNCII